MVNSKKKGWLFILPWPLSEIGGVNRVVLELCKKSFLEGAFHPYVLINTWECREAVIQKNEYYTQIELRIRSPFGRKNRIKALISYLLHLHYEIINLKGIINGYHIEVVNPHYIGNSTFTFFILKKILKNKFKLILSMHGSDFLDCRSSKGFERSIFEAVLSSADAIVGCSRGFAVQIARAFPQVQDKVGSINNGINELFYEAEVHSMECLSEKLKGKVFLLSVGTFEKKKVMIY